MRQLSRRTSIEESPTLAFTNRARALRAAGVDVITMTAGEPDFPTAMHVKAAALEAIANDFTHYTAVQGIPQLLDAIAEKFERENALKFTSRQLAVTAGAKQAIANTLFVLCEEGDDVLLPAPYWVSYPALVRLTGARPIPVPSTAENGFRPTMQGLKKALTSRTRAIIINSPNNPAGTVYTAEELHLIAEFAQHHDLFIISDEIYEGLTFDGRRHVSIGSFPEAEGRTVTVNGFSKRYAMTGWRIGYLGGPEKIVHAATKIQGQMTSNANSIAQKAAIAALRGPQDAVVEMCTEYQKRRDLAVRALRSIPSLDVPAPEGAMFVFFGVSRLLGRRANGTVISGSTDLVEHLLDRRHVVLVPGGGFGDDSCIRLSFACGWQELEEGLRRITEGIQELQ